MIFGDKKHKNVLVSCDHGLMIVNRFDSDPQYPDVGQAQFILDHGNASSIEGYTTFERCKNTIDPIIFDVGANIGTYATVVSKLCPTAKIYCFEPQRLIFQMLCGNFAINNLENCYAYPIALGDISEWINIDEPDYNQQGSFGSFSIIKDVIKTRANKQTPTQKLTLDDFVEIYKVRKVDFIKIDAEGMDIEVLKGAVKTLKSFNPSLLIENVYDGVFDMYDIIEYLREKNYEFMVNGGNNVLVVPKINKDDI